MSRFARSLFLFAGTLCLAMTCATAQAGGHRHHRHHGAGCATCGPVVDCAPQPQLVTRTIMVPETYYEMETVPVTVCRPEVRSQTITVMRRVPEVRPVRLVSTVMETRTEMRTVNYPVQIPTWRMVARQVPVMVPYTQMRQGVRTVPRLVEETVMQTVCRDAGHYECRSYVDCCGCTHTCQVWVPQTVTEQVPVSVCRTEYDQVPYEFPVTVCRPELRTIQDRVCDVHVEMRSTQVPYAYCVPRQVERVVHETHFRCVPEQQVVNHTVLVPHVEYRQRPVCRTRLVPKQVTCMVYPPPCAGCP